MVNYREIIQAVFSDYSNTRVATGKRESMLRLLKSHEAYDKRIKTLKFS